MIENVKNIILSTLQKAIRIIESKHGEGFYELKELSNETIQNSSIYQDDYSISIAVIIYSVSKIIERSGEIDKKLLRRMKEMQVFLSEGHETNFHRALRNTILEIGKADSKLGMYIQEVLQQAKIKKGSKIYERGISVARSADLLGISQWQLMDYIGKTTISDTTPSSLDVKKRLELARRLFISK